MRCKIPACASRPKRTKYTGSVPPPAVPWDIPHGDAEGIYEEDIMKLPALLLLFIALASGAALAQADAGKNPAPPFSITIRVLPSPVIQLGSRYYIGLEIVLTNLSDHPMDAPSAWFNGVDRFDAEYGIDIRDNTGKKMEWVPPDDVAGFMPDAIKSDTLEPGKSKSELVEIENFFPGMRKPGSYIVQVKHLISLKNPQGGGAPIEDATKGEIKSNEITITVVAAKPAGQP